MRLSKTSSLIILSSLLFIATDCKKESAEPDMACGVADPVSNLKWLNDLAKAFVGGPETNGIVLYSYNGNDVIEVQSGLASSTNQHQYRCSGERIDFDDAIAFRDYRDKRIEIRVLYGTRMW